MKSVLKTAPTSEPLDITEVNLHLKTSDENDYINELIITARHRLERYLNRAFILQTWTGYSDCWRREFYFDQAPLLGVTHIKYYDDSGTLQTLNSANYWVDTKDQPGEVELAYDFTPPQLQLGRPNAIEIEYTAGYLATGTAQEKAFAVPDPIRHAMKVLITDMYEHRGQYVIGNIAGKLPDFVLDIVHSYKLYSFA